MLDYKALAKKLLMSYYTRSFDYCCITTSKVMSRELKSWIYNDTFETQINITGIKIVFEVFSSIELNKALEFFNINKALFQELVYNTLIVEYGKVAGMTILISSYISIYSIISNWDLFIYPNGILF